MATTPAQLNTSTNNTPRFSISNYLPFTKWLLNYERENLSGDIIAGIIVAVMLVPQGMAYALLAGLPPEVGLYASITPLIIYGLMGTSRTLSVGPTAVTSLLVASGIGALAPQSTAEYVGLALILALQIGIIQIIMGIFRVGFLVNFLSHPVLSGFVSAAAIIIATGQIKHLIGLDMPRSEHFYEPIFHAIRNISQINLPTVFIAVLSIGILLYFKFGLKNYLKRLGMPEHIRVPLSKMGPLVVVLVGTLTVGIFSWSDLYGVSIVGTVPSGLPPLSLPSFNIEHWKELLPTALTISLIGFMESISIAKSLASKKREKVIADQELIALGFANMGTSLTGGYPVTGGLSRSVVNFSAGANTGLASIITAILMLLTVVFFTPLFYFLPSAVLAAIIFVAVLNLLDFKTLIHTWHYNKLDTASLIVTFLAVLFTGIEDGILIGAASSIALYLFRTSRPHTAIVGRIDDTEHFRNVTRHDVTTYDGILLVRMDESLYFSNAQYLENHLLGCVADHTEIDHLVLVCSAVNYIDSSALDVLEALIDEMHDAGVDFYLAEVKGPVMDRLKKIGFVDKLGKDRFFLSTHRAVEALTMSENAYPPSLGG